MAVTVASTFSYDFYEDNLYGNQVDTPDSGGSTPKDQQDCDDVNFFFNFGNVSHIHKSFF